MANDWRERAACRGTLTELWYDTDPDTTAACRRVCAGCEVRADCHADAVARDERYGIWGGVDMERAPRRPAA